MIFINHYLGLEPLDLTTEVIINFSSTLAIFIFFFKDIKNLIFSSFNCKQVRKYIFYLVIASLPACIIGFLFKDYIDKYYLSFYSSSIMLLFTGLFLLLSFYILKKNTNLSEEINLQSSITIGIFQSIALIPGLSRSGLTLTSGLVTNNSVKSTLKFSFFLYLIASFGALVLEVTNININEIDYLSLIISSIASFITTTFSIRWFFNKLNKKWILFFSIYSFLVGSINLMEHFSFF